MIIMGYCKYIIISLLLMASLIEIEEQQIMSQQQTNKLYAIKQMLKSIFKSHCFICKNVTDDGKNLVFTMKNSNTTYRLSTVWHFNFVGQVFNLQISFYNSTQTDLLRAETIRMRIELSILTQIVNNQVLPGFGFLVDTQSGLLKLTCFQSWPVFYSLAANKQNLFNLINNYYAQLRRFDELMLFIQPAVFDTRQATHKDKTPHGKINRFRALLKSTRNSRRQIQACFKDIIKFKQLGTVYQEQLNQVRSLYMKNITAFQKSIYGLEEADPFLISPEHYQQELKEIRKNQRGVTNYESLIGKNNKKRLNKILFGLHKIEGQKESQQKILSQEGAHSQIFRNTFRYVVVQTINEGTINLDRDQWLQRRLEFKGELTYKTCKKTSETSRNSFCNQIKALDYMRDMYSPFVAKYYMLIKQSWDENDTIYMSNYRQNVHNLLKNCTAYGIKTRLELSYQIAKGLCFLYSKQVAHRDMKPQNIVVDENLTPKIIDFGSAISHYMKNRFKTHDERLLTTQGYNVQYYLIPPGFEHLRQKYNKSEYDEHPLFDVYGFGRTLCYIFFNSLDPPHPELFLSQPLFEVLDHIIFLVNMCINVDPEDRPGFGQLTAFLGSLKQLVKDSVEEGYMINSNDSNQIILDEQL